MILNAHEQESHLFEKIKQLGKIHVQQCLHLHY